MDLSINPIPITDIHDPAIHSILSGFYYVIPGIGGYSIEEQFNTIQINPIQITSYDITNALQVLYDVGEFNIKLGNYNSNTSMYENNNISLNAYDFKTHMTENQVISVGKYSTLYSDFSSYVNGLFGYTNGFSMSLFSANTDLPMVFNAAEFINIINSQSIDSSGSYINDLSGEIQINNVSSIIQTAISSNIFNNRDPSMNYTMNNKFVAGDLIYIPSGTTVKLKVNIQINLPSPDTWLINEIGMSYIENILTPTYDYNYQPCSTNNCNDTSYTAHTITTLPHVSNITRTITAPLLIKLVNIYN